MNRTIRAIMGAMLVLVITLAAISICQDIGKRFKIDITDQKLYTLSDGTKAILAKLNQPITAKLFYAETAALKGPDQIRFFNNYYQFVRALLEEYVAVSKGMLKLEVIDPRPFSEEEAEAVRYDLQKFPITQEESFFFGLVIKTQFGVEKVIKFFSPDRQNFVEYDISYLIDTAITREKSKIGILSSLPVMGDDMTGYMAQMMRMQGRQPKGAWTIVEQLRRQYEVKQVPTDVNDINDVDILLVIHPKDLPERTVFAIDQYVLKGGRTILCVDPHCLSDTPAQPQNPMMPQQQSQKSDLNALTVNWGVTMPDNTIAGDLNLALAARMGEDGIVGFLGLRPGCFSKESVSTAELNQVTFLYAGALNEAGEPMDPNAPPLDVKRTPLVTTTDQGNTIRVDSPYELMFRDPAILRNKFTPGVKPVIMGYLLTGKFKTAFPNGIAVEIPVESDDAGDENKDEEEKTTTKLIKPEITRAVEDCAVIVFSDVDFISDMVAYRESFFGSKMVVGDNSALLLNAIDELSGSSDLVSIRSRGNFRRPFGVVDAIEKEAQEKTAEKMKAVEAEIAAYNADLQKMLASAKEGDEEVLGNAIIKQRRDLEQRIYDAERQKRVIRMQGREGIDGLGRKLQRLNTLMIPIAVLIVAIAVGLRRSSRKRHYISHASDA
ncbi:MAG: GldG family protein [Sedimentisphaerales bacterium]|nr:GldG family protein [Sedimentisphaerales bacterium]